MDDQVKKELLSVSLDGLNIKPTPKNPKSMQCIKAINEMLLNFDNSLRIPYDLVDFCLYTFPQIENEDVFLACVIWVIWAFVLDDHLTHNPQDFSKWYKILNDENLEFLGDGIIERWYRFFSLAANRGLTKPKSMHEVLRLSLEWLETYEKFQQLTSGGKQLSDQKFIDIRLKDVAAPICFYFLQADAGLEVTTELASDDNWIKFIRNATVNLIIINELFSLKREVIDGQGQMNYVYIKMKNNNLRAQEAVQQLIFEAENSERMARYHGRKLKEFFEIAGMNAYVDGVIATMGGNLYWSFICKRYKLV